MNSRYLWLLLGALVTVAPAFCQPLIGPDGVVNSASFAPARSPGGAVAQGSIFSIFGTGLGPATGVQPTAFPLLTTLGGVSVKVTQGNTSVDAIPLYASAGLVNAIMPSNAPTGRVSVRVTYNGTAGNFAPVRIAVNAPGIYSATGAGLGPGILQNFVSATVQPINSAFVTATPGQTMILWLTGLGPIKAPDNLAPPVGSLSFPVEIWVGGKQVTNIAYSGRTPCCAGVDQVVFTLPANVPAGCFVPVTVRVAGTAVGNTVTMAIDANGSACSDSANPLSGPLTQGGKLGAVGLMRTSLHSDSGTFPDITADRAVAAFNVPVGAVGFIFNAAVAIPPAGSCTVYSAAGNIAGETPLFAFNTRVMDAGTLTLTAASGRQTFSKVTLGSPVYSTTQGSSLSGSPPLYVNPGLFQISGAGGSDVSAFNLSLTVSATGLNWTNSNQIQSVDRTQPLNFTWSGTAGAVVITGSAYDVPNNLSGEFLCVAPTGATSFSVPSWVLANLPPSQTIAANSRNRFGVTGVSSPVSFTASGLDNGIGLVVSAQQKALSVR